MDEAKPGKLCTSPATRVAPGADGCKTGEAVMVGTLTRSPSQQTPQLAQPDHFSSLSRDRAIFADDCADSSWCALRTRYAQRWCGKERVRLRSTRWTGALCGCWLRRHVGFANVSLRRNKLKR